MTSSGHHPLPHGRGETYDIVDALGVGQPRGRQKIKRQKGTTHKRKRNEKDNRNVKRATSEMEEHARIRKSREKSGTR